METASPSKPQQRKRGRPPKVKEPAPQEELETETWDGAEPMSTEETSAEAPAVSEVAEPSIENQQEVTEPAGEAVATDLIAEDESQQAESSAASDAVVLSNVGNSIVTLGGKPEERDVSQMRAEDEDDESPAIVQPVTAQVEDHVVGFTSYLCHGS